MRSSQNDLFHTPPPAPEGLRRVGELISPDEERALVETIAGLPLKPFEFRGYEGKRRVAFFGWRYDFDGRGLGEAEPIPAFLLPLREKAASFLGVQTEALPHVLVTEYAPGAPIGWHRDRPEFGDVVGVSLLSPCTFRLRRRKGTGWERHSFIAEPRAAYALQGPARSEWEHSIPAVAALRYSVTFRTLR
ncbi:MAG TPA: alpha-ketoglutarate-dependent dioxygenase AlkB [Caulobacteraceae bacterium]|jgi:alkylated DNA repair dioxygenase AlkB